MLSTHFFITGTTVKPVGMDNKHPIMKSWNHLAKKPLCIPSRIKEIPKLITAVMEIEINTTNKTDACVLDNLIFFIFLSLVNMPEKFLKMAYFIEKMQYSQPATSRIC